MLRLHFQDCNRYIVLLCHPCGEVAKFLADNPDHVANVDGHCDERGSNEYNLSLGEQRAQSVRTYLITAGIDAARIQTRSFGKEKPAAQGADEGAMAKNRRAEISYR